MGVERLHYFDPDVTLEMAESNLRQYVTENIRNLDQIPRSNEILSRYLGCDNKKSAVARALISKGWLGAEIPTGHSCVISERAGGETTMYLRPDVVGEAQYQSNLHRVISYSYKTLDDIEINYRRTQVLLRHLNMSGGPRTLEKYALENGILSPIPPNGHPLLTWRSRSPYFDRELVGDENWRMIMRKAFSPIFKSFDDINTTKVSKLMLRSAGVGEGSLQPLRDFARQLVLAGVISRKMPRSYRHPKDAKYHFLVDSYVVGRIADRNVQRYVQTHYPSPDLIPKECPFVAHGLGCYKTKGSIVQTLRSRVWYQNALRNADFSNNQP